jgi:hypothetical protein
MACELCTMSEGISVHMCKPVGEGCLPSSKSHGVH